ncbi:peptidase S24/S26A/S26B/S26C family protein [Carex rostrata]
MMAISYLRQLIKNTVVGGTIGLAISDRYASVVPVHGNSMHPTFKECPTTFSGLLSGDLALSEKACLGRYEFSHGDVVVFRSLHDHRRNVVKRIIGLPGDWIRVPDKAEILKVPVGHCWVEGDNLDVSLDSRSYGPIPLGLIRGRVTHVIWPPHRIRQVERKVPEGRVSQLD